MSRKIIILILFASFSAVAKPPPGSKPAELRICGYGFFGNRELKRIINNLELSGKKPRFFGAEFVEDSSLILTSKIKRDGYLEPEVSVELTLQNGGHMHVTADE